MKALITGVTGFAGLYLAEYLLRSHDVVIGCSGSGQWSDETPKAVRGQVELIAWDVADSVSEGVRACVEAFAPDAIYHLAAMSIPGECGEGRPTAGAVAVNVRGTRHVLTLAQSLDCRPRVLVASSAHVYAPVVDGASLVDEEAPLGPTTAYGITKLDAERECERAARAGVPVIIARAFQHAGPRQQAKFMLPEWARQFARPKSNEVRVVTLDSYLDLSDVRDVVRAYRLLVARRVAGIVNVGSGQCIRSGDIFEQLLALTGHRHHVLQLQPGRRQHPIARTKRLAAATQWSPEIPLARTIADTLAYWQWRVAQ